MTRLLGETRLSAEIVSIAEVLRELQAEEQTAVSSETTGQTSRGGGSTGSGVLGAVESVFGLSLNPLVSGLADLFGGGGSAELAPLVPHVAPPSINVNAGISSRATRVFATDPAPGGSSPAPAPTITVQVQALDSQSFLDRSQDIAAAVRKAMLESTTLNDVIRAV
jgi:hypothetical protein